MKRLVWLLGAMSLVVARSNAADRQAEPEGGATSQRTLHFPSDRAIGMVYWRLGADRPFAPHSMYNEAWKSLGEARGDIVVPPKAEVRLDVSQAASADLSALDSLQSDDIQFLNLRDTDLNDEGLTHVGRLAGLRVAELRHTRITDAGSAHLANLYNLKEISLDAFGVERDGFGVGDEAMKVLGQLPALECVGLRLTKVTDAGLAALCDCQTLTQLDLSGTKVSDAGMMHLQRLPKLNSLRLGVYEEGANITDEGLKVVGELVKLKHLNLSGTKITERGLAHLEKLSNLEDLSLDNTNIKEAGLASLEPLQALKRLRLYTRHPTTDVGAEHLAKLKSLERLTEHLHVTDQGVALLATLPELSELELSGKGVTDASATTIAGMKSLKWLHVQECPITDATLEALASAPKLEYLLLSRTKVTGDGYRNLRTVPPLRILDINFGLRDEQADGLKPNLREVGKLLQLKDLRIRGDGLSSADLGDLTGLVGLEKMDIRFPVDDQGAFYLAGFDRLKNLRIESGTFTDVGLEQLSLLRNLESMQISGHFTDKGLERLGRLKALRQGWFGSPYVTDAGLKSLARSLPTLQHVSTGYYPGFRLSDITITEKDTIRRYGDAQDRAAKDALEDQPPPALTVKDWINAGENGVDLTKLDGKVVLVDFWGTWCGPCIASMPKLKTLHEKYIAQGLIILGVHTTDGAENMPDYATREEIAWPMAVDIDKATVGAWKVQSYPTMYVIDRWGKVRFAGLYRGDVERAVVQLLEESVPPSAPAKVN